MTDPFIPVPVDDPLQLAWFECNDYGNARRLSVLAKGLLKWVDDAAWVAFDGRRWSEREGAFRAHTLAHQVAQHVHEELAALGDLIGDPKNPNAKPLSDRYGAWCTPTLALEHLKKLSRHALDSGNANKTRAMLSQAQNLPGMRGWSEDFDVDPLTYNLANGTLRFKKKDGPSTGSGRAEAGEWVAVFREGHEPTDMLCRIAEWAYDPKATCPVWEQRLELVQPDASVRAVLPRMYGQTLTGLTDSEEFYVHKGRGGDGKTKTHEILLHGHGDYGCTAAVSTWLQSSIQRGGAEHRRDLVDLAGDVRFVLSAEPPRNSTWDGALLKEWTGGGEIKAFQAGAKAATVFKPRGNLFVEVNPTPKMPGDDKGFRRRLRLTQWTVDLEAIPGGYESPTAVREKLWAESSGILNWLIAGCLDWLGDRKVPVPEPEREALADFWNNGNPLGEWLAEECDVTDRMAETGSTLLWQAFKAWMERGEAIDEETRKKWNTTRFGTELSQRQIIARKTRGMKMRVGIRLLGAGDLLGGVSGAAAQHSPPSPQATDDFDDDLDPFGAPR